MSSPVSESATTVPEQAQESLADQVESTLSNGQSTARQSVRKWNKVWTNVTPTLKILKWVPVRPRHIADPYPTNSDAKSTGKIFTDDKFYNAPITRSITAAFSKDQKKTEAMRSSEKPGTKEEEDFEEPLERHQSTLQSVSSPTIPSLASPTTPPGVL